MVRVVELKYYRVVPIADRLGVSVSMTFVATNTMGLSERRFEHLAHEVGHAMLLGIPIEQRNGEVLGSFVQAGLHKTRGRRKYRDEAHILVATYRLMNKLGCNATLKDFEVVSREQKCHRREWDAALRSPRTRWLAARLREYFVAEGVIA